MKVQELINLLSDCDPNNTVSLVKIENPLPEKGVNTDTFSFKTINVVADQVGNVWIINEDNPAIVKDFLQKFSKTIYPKS